MRTLLIISAILLNSAAGFGQKKEELKAKKYLAKVVLSGKQEYQYYALSEINRTEYTVKGPGKLYVNVRVRITGNQLQSQPLNIKYIRSGKKVEILEVPALLAGNLKFKNKNLKGSSSRMERIEIDVPPGKHSYRFYKHKAEQKVHIRCFYEKHPDPQWVDVNPVDPLVKKTVRFVGSGKNYDYYQLTKANDFSFSTEDTARIRIVLRPEFTYRMLEEAIYRVKVHKLNSDESKVYKLQARKSGAVEFVEDKKHTLGSPTIFYLNLPKPSNGMDTYSITLLGGSKSVVMRLSQDLKLDSSLSMNQSH